MPIMKLEKINKIKIFFKEEKRLEKMPKKIILEMYEFA